MNGRLVALYIENFNHSSLLNKIVKNHGIKFYNLDGICSGTSILKRLRRSKIQIFVSSLEMVNSRKKVTKNLIHFQKFQRGIRFSLPHHVSSYSIPQLQKKNEICH